ncbi:hypothetical protein H9L39_03802 [Fusarium oxysporum f. sp. albedinis]|nr:hypothetical protein H9L39_03802 [Fusarium oxysporum f. sp. albedinis]
MGVYPVLQPRICHDRQRRSALNPGPDLKTHSNIRPRSAAEDCFGFIARPGEMTIRTCCTHRSQAAQKERSRRESNPRWRNQNPQS